MLAQVGEPHRIMASLAGALKILHAFDGKEPTLTLATIGERAGLAGTKAQHLVSLLEQLGYLHVRGDLISLELTTISLGFAARPSTLAALAKRRLQDLAESTGATISLGALINGEVLFLTRIRNSDVMAANVTVGSTIPARTSLIGQLLLAFASTDELQERYASWELGGADLASLERQLAKIRKDGYAASGGDLGEPLYSISVPVLKSDGHALAAINLAIASTNREKVAEATLLSGMSAAARELEVQALDAGIY